MKTGTEKEAVVYVRSATIEQVETSFGTQIEGCIALAAQFGDVIRPENIFREVGSGINIDTRLVLQELRRKIASGLVRVLYIYDMDRLSRDVHHLVMLMREFEDAGVELRCVMGKPTEGYQRDGLVTFIKRFCARIENDQITERGAGSGLYGYDC